jgi:Plavaka transposase
VTTKKLTTPFIHEASEIKNWGVRDPYHEGHDHPGLFRSLRDFFQRLETLEGTQAGWQELEIKGPNGEYKSKAWMRDPLAVLQEILENRTIDDKVVWAPRRMYDQAGNRVYTDLHTTDWWWDTQVSTMYHLVLTEDEDR